MIAMATGSPAYEVELTDSPEPAARDAIVKLLLAFNVDLLGPSGIRPLALLIRSPDNRQIVGGLWARTSFAWMFVELLFVPEELRGGGLGGRLLDLAEREARKRECRGAWLETLSTDACRFYRRHGFQVFGALDDYPQGNARTFLCKRFKS